MLRRRAHGKMLPANRCRDTALKLHGKFSCHLDSSASPSLAGTQESHVPHRWLLVPVTREVTVPVLTSLSSSSRLQRPRTFPPQEVPLVKRRQKKIKVAGLRFATAGQSGKSGGSRKPPWEEYSGSHSWLRPASPLCFLHVVLVPKLPQSVRSLLKRHPLCVLSM